MRIRIGFSAPVIAVLSFAISSFAQSPDMRQFIDSMPKISADEAIERALKSSSVTYEGKPFHALLQISQPDDDASPYQGSVEVFWARPDKYKTIVISKTFQQIRIVNGEVVEERNTGDYYPTWLRNYVNALMNPLPRVDLFRGNKSPVLLGGNNYSSCIGRNDRTNGITDEGTRGSLCFTGIEPRIKLEMDFTNFMEFSDGREFGGKIVARIYTAHTPDYKQVVGKLVRLESLAPSDEESISMEQVTPPSQRLETTFLPIATSEALLEKVPVIDWPPVTSGKGEGNMIIHVVTDRTGQVREAYGYNSDMGGDTRFGAEQALKYKFKPHLVHGVPQQIETPLVIHFKSKIEPLPVVRGDEVAIYTEGCKYNPILPKGVLPSGTKFVIKVGVNEQGKLTGESFPQNVPMTAWQQAKLDVHACKFKPYLKNGVPWYHGVEFEFTAP